MSRGVELTVSECRERLARGVVGRVAMATPMGPRIIPVSYVLHGDAVVFRTTPYSQLSTYGWNAELAFEIDDLDCEQQRGWSVVAVGRAAVVEDPAEVAAIRHIWDPLPWVSGSRNLYVRLAWRQLTGLRIDEAEASTPRAPARDREPIGAQRPHRPPPA